MATYKSEAEVYSALVRRFPPPAFAVLPGVANGTGGSKRRTIDALVMSLWPSRGLTLEAVEIKVSRGDYLRELKDPAKAEPIMKYCDRFWLAVGNAEIVQADLPTTWGLLVPDRGKLKIAKQAPDLVPESLTRSFIAAIMRRANEAIEGDEIRRRIRMEIEAEQAEAMADLRDNAMSPTVIRELERLREIAKQVEAFERASGVRFTKWETQAVEHAASIVRTINESGAERVVARARAQLANARGAGERMVEDATRGEDRLEELAKRDRSTTLDA